MKVFKHYIAFLCFQMLGVSAALAEINWQEVESLDTQISLPIRSVAVASDGALWRTYSAWKTTYIERIDLQTGLATARMQLNTSNYELVADTSDANMWFVGQGGASLISPSLETLESRRGFSISLPGRRFYSNNAISTVGRLKVKTVELITNTGNPKYFSGYGLGLWESNSDSNGITIAKIDLSTGRAARSVLVPDCYNDAVALSESRAITSTCLIDTNTGTVLRRLSNDQFLLGTRQHSNSGYFIRSNSLALHVYAASTGAEIWSLPSSGQPRVTVVGETLVTQVNARLMGFEIATGNLIFNVAVQDIGGEKFDAITNAIVFNRNDRTEIYSPLTGLLVRSIPANSIKPIASSMQIASTEDAIYLSSLFVENSMRSFIQVTKRNLFDGGIIWRKTFQHEQATPGSCGWTQCGTVSVSGSASDGSFVLSAALRSGAIIHSIVMSLAPDTGLVRWREDADFSDGVTDGALLYANALGNGAVQISRTPYANSLQTTKIVDEVSGLVLWTPVGNYLPLIQGGDFLHVDGRALERIDGRTGQLIWRNNNADIDLGDLISVTSNEIAYRARDSIWNPISFAQISINRLNLANGQISIQTVPVASNFVRASAITFDYFFFQAPTQMQTALAVRLFKPSTNLTNYLIITQSDSTMLTDSNLAGRRVLMRPRGLGISKFEFRDGEQFYGFAGGVLYRMDDINADGTALKFWQSLPPTRYFDSEKYITAYNAKSTSAPRSMLEREFNGRNIRYLISKVSAIDAPESKVALKLSKRFLGITQLGEYRYVLHIENSGRNPIIGAQVLSELANVNSFTCIANRGRCNQTSTLGSFSLQLDLLPGGFAELMVLDVSTSTNSIGVMAPMDTVESDTSDNLVELGPNAVNVVEFADGFE